MRNLRIGLAAVVVALAGFVVAVPALSSPSAVKLTSVKVIAGKPSEFKYKFARLSAPKGVVVFKVTNLGMIPHDLKIAGKKTRLLNTGQSATIRLVFNKPGRYPFLCTVPGHAIAGMKGVFIVKGSAT